MYLKIDIDIDIVDNIDIVDSIKMLVVSRLDKKLVCCAIYFDVHFSGNSSKLNMYKIAKS